MEIEKPPLSHPPKKPLMLFDGDCHFCRTWIARWHFMTEDKVDYGPYQDYSVRYQEIPIKDFQASVQLLMPSGFVYSGARAVFEALAVQPLRRWPLWFYKNIPLVRQVSEFFYSLVARNRVFFSRLTKLIWGHELIDNQYFIARWLFLKFLGVIYLVAFWSLSVQIIGLVGSDGISPAHSTLNQIAQRFGPERFWFLPSIFWISISDTLLTAVCYAGMGLSIALILGVCPSIVLVVLWGLYLSLFSVGSVFLRFQWDILLLETGFLAIFLSPLMFRQKMAREAAPSNSALFLLRLLLFKLMLTSGLVKLTSNDSTWSNLTALNFHYETQPLPTWTSWYMHQLPEWFHKFSVLGMFAIELILPVFVFFPRRIRYTAAFGIIFLQLLIIATGNYCFFNWLTIALSLLLCDDSIWPRRWRDLVVTRRKWSKDFPAPAWPRWILAPLVSVIVLMTIVTWPGRLGINIQWPSFLLKGVHSIRGFHIVNHYGLFAVMTTTRPEIIVEGSMDGQEWKEYEFKYKPGDLKRSPVFVAPHQPRLDWQMWFAALGSVQQNPWFVNFCVRLLQGSEPVLKLIEKNPFSEDAPRFVRATLYDYNFSDRDLKRTQKMWWKRKNGREYLPPVSLTGQ